VSALDGVPGRGSTSGPTARSDLVRASIDGEPAATTPEQLQRVAMTAYLIGRDADWATLLTRAYQELVNREDREAAARCAFWLAFSLINNGQWAVAGGWLTRARRLLAGIPGDSATHGYLLLPEAMRQAAAGEFGRTWKATNRAAEIGDRFRDADLTALARSVQGRAAIRMGDTANGVGLLDEAMLAITTENVLPLVATTVYCGLIEACHEIFDFRRAREWTEQLTGWYGARPEVRLNRDRCFVYRAHLLKQGGDWTAAIVEAQQAEGWHAGDSTRLVVGAAHYLCADVHRLRGSWEKAEKTYNLASSCGHDPQPGLALLRLAQGDVDTAMATIRRAVSESPARPDRPALLAAQVEIAVFARDLSAARTAVAELDAIARQLDAPYLHATAAQASASVLVANGDPGEALGPLRRAMSIWQSLEFPYELARCRALLGLACRDVGDEDTARLEIAAARTLCQRLGADVDTAMTRTRTGPAAPATVQLTARELDVLRLVATGATNRAIADQLGLSEKTIARHLSNILTKLGLRSRAAATAYAYQQKLM
jgi:DNA-binding CsgD family transcriptional regulator